MTAASPLLVLFVCLSAAVLLVPLAGRLGLGSVLGYLIGGILIGPWGLALVTDGQAMLEISEFGVVLLLFLVGLELSPGRLWALRRPIFGAGTMQLLLSALPLFGLLWTVVALPWRGALVGAFALALSSTAMALQIMQERTLTATPAGRSGFAILLFQDLAVIPLMALLPLLAPGGGEGTPHGEGVRAAEAVAAVLALVGTGHFALRPVLRFIAATGIHEIFVAFALFLVIGIALLMEAVGLSMALGSFIAGVLLADSEYRHALETVIEPFKGLLMGIFFIAVGMGIDFGLLRSHAGMVVSIVAALVTIKAAVLWWVGRVGGVPAPQRPFFSIVLSQGGEFAFVLLSFASADAIVTPEAVRLLVLVVALSMMTTPLLLLLHDRLLAPRLATAVPGPDRCDIDHEERPVVIAGFGRFGEVVGRLLMAHNIGVTLLDHDPDRIERSREYGFKVFFGSAARLDLLRAAGLERARVLVIAIDDPARSVKVARLVRQYFPHVRIVARAREMRHLFSFRELGVRYAYRECFDGAIRAARGAMEALGMEREEIEGAIRRFLDYDRQVLDTMYAVRNEGEAALARASMELRERFHAMEKEAKRASGRARMR
ncbi:MAG: glutathione-regulated potassium-efflux system protein KefC [Zetaproteobacteria bacterium]|nr:MAG: glutathione-regulated potassium-efflux system protein KefC [Zetaproteobacteria bacterium]